MDLTRRGWLGLAAGGAAAVSWPALAAGPAMPATITMLAAGGIDYRPALAAIRAYAEAELTATGLPGMTLAIVDDVGFAATICVGWADVGNRIPVRPDHLFEIGSISKSISALWLHAAADKGRLDLSQTIQQALPDAPLPDVPITLQQVLNHCGGLPDDAPVFPRTPDARLWSGFRPGSRFSYSNTGYDLLGLVIDRVAGRPHAQVLADEVLTPLGMAGAVAHLRAADRPRFAVGYNPVGTDRPALTRVPMQPGPWNDMDMTAGSVGAPGPAMLGYLRYVLALGQGKGGVMMSDAAARRLLATTMKTDEFAKDGTYASGFATVPIDGKPVLHHTGGMILFTSSFHADPVAGVGAFASVNGTLDAYRPRRTTAYAVQVLRAARKGAKLPPPPDPLAFRAVDKPERFVGRYVGPGGDVIALSLANGKLVIENKGARGRIETGGKDALVTDHPRLAVHLLEFEKPGTGEACLWWGDRLYGRDHAPEQPQPAAGLTALAGDYMSGDPWSFPVSLLVRGDRLIAEGAGEIVRRPGGWWSLKEDEGGVERIWIDAPLGGRPSRLSWSGKDLIRVA